MNGVRMVHERGIWLEIVTLLITGFNDDEAELRDMAHFWRASAAIFHGTSRPFIRITR